MISDSILTEEQFIQQATAVLMYKVGLVETLRFSTLTTRGRIESVERHRAWQATLDKDAFFDDVLSRPPKTCSVPD